MVTLSEDAGIRVRGKSRTRTARERSSKKTRRSLAGRFVSVTLRRQPFGDNRLRSFRRIAFYREHAAVT
jgi:hypothetical protein